MGAFDSVSLHKIAKATKKMRKRQTCLSAIKNSLFDLDIYAYTPSLMTAQFSTWISLLVTLCVGSLFGFCVGYTLYLWAATDYGISQGEVSHDNSSVLIPPSQADGQTTLVLPQAGVLLLLGNGTSPVDPSIVRFTWEQAVICYGQAGSKKVDPIPSKQCEFRSAEDNSLRANTTFCPSWDAAIPRLAALNNTAADPCGTLQLPNAAQQVYYDPRIAGTFYDSEYAYVTATVAVNASLLRSKSFASMLYKGSVQLFLSYPYTGTSSLTQGHWPDGETVIWSRRVNLLANSTMKWEVSLRVRQVSASSYFWDIPSLQGNALDYTVMFSEISIASSNPGPDGYQEIAKVYLKLDDRDMQVSMSPYGTVFSLFSDWGGFLSILVALGIPAMLYNQAVFRGTVEALMERGDITFDEELRKRRSEAIATSFAVGVAHKDMASRKQSVMRFATAIDNSSQGMAQREDSLMAGYLKAGRDSGEQLVMASSVDLPGGVPESSATMGGSSLRSLRASLSQRSNRVAPLPQPTLTQTSAPTAVPPPAGLPGDDLRSGSQEDGSGVQDSVGSTTDVAVQQASGIAGLGQAPGAQPGHLQQAWSLTKYNQTGQPVAESISNNQELEQSSDLTSTSSAVAPDPRAGGAQHVHSTGAALQGQSTLVMQESAEVLAAAPDMVVSAVSMSTKHSNLQARPPSGTLQPRPPLSFESPSTQGFNQEPGDRSLSSNAAPALSRAGGSQLRFGGISIASRIGSEADLSQASNMYEAPQATGTASILVKYHQDIFEDSDEDEDDFDDVVRHCTSECHALYHLRQVVKLVQHERAWLTCGSEKMAFTGLRKAGQSSNGRALQSGNGCAGHSNEGHTVSAAAETKQEPEQNLETTQSLWSMKHKSHLPVVAGGVATASEMTAAKKPEEEEVPRGKARKPLAAIQAQKKPASTSGQSKHDTGQQGEGLAQPGQPKHAFKDGQEVHQFVQRLTQGMSMLVGEEDEKPRKGRRGRPPAAKPEASLQEQLHQGWGDQGYLGHVNAAVGATEPEEVADAAVLPEYRPFDFSTLHTEKDDYVEVAPAGSGNEQADSNGNDAEPVDLPAADSAQQAQAAASLAVRAAALPTASKGSKTGATQPAASQKRMTTTAAVPAAAAAAAAALKRKAAVATGSASAAAVPTVSANASVKQYSSKPSPTPQKISNLAPMSAAIPRLRASNAPAGTVTRVPWKASLGSVQEGEALQPVAARAAAAQPTSSAAAEGRQGAAANCTAAGDATAQPCTIDLTTAKGRPGPSKAAAGAKPGPRAAGRSKRPAAAKQDVVEAEHDDVDASSDSDHDQDDDYKPAETKPVSRATKRQCKGQLSAAEQAAAAAVSSSPKAEPSKPVSQNASKRPARNSSKPPAAATRNTQAGAASVPAAGAETATEGSAAEQQEALQAEHLQQPDDRLRQELQKAKAALAKAQQEKKAVQEELALEKDAREEVQHKVDALQSERRGLREYVAKLEYELQQARAKKAADQSLQDCMQATNKKLEDIQSQLHTALQERDALQEQLHAQQEAGPATKKLKAAEAVRKELLRMVEKPWI